MEKSGNNETRRNTPQKLEDVISRYIKAMRMEGKLEEVRLIRHWEDIVGKTIALSTTKIYLKDHILHLHIRSSVIKNELHYLKKALIEKINQKTESEFITDIELH
ncbi:MAG: DUF721 domain-containing protein [Bacteroidota bacterium]